MKTLRLNRAVWYVAGTLVSQFLGFSGAVSQTSLKQVFGRSFLVGAALNDAQFTGVDARGSALVKTQFNSITAENALKWERIHPEEGTYRFEDADAFVSFGVSNGMFIVGHTLIWHSQTPRWVFEDETGKRVGRETLLGRMRDHIHTVVGRYKGRIKGWDVVNEALEEDGSLRRSPWMEIIGEDYIDSAFQFAHEADADLELYYNDHSLENEPRRRGAVALVSRLRSAGIPVAGIGTQGHYKMDWPTLKQVEETIDEFGGLGVKVMVTELDIDVLPAATSDYGADVAMRARRRTGLDPYADGLPDSVQERLAKRYADLFAVFEARSKLLDRVTFWGVTDGDSWLNDWPVRGRNSYPLLFDRQGKTKPAFEAVVKTASPVP